MTSVKLYKDARIDLARSACVHKQAISIYEDSLTYDARMARKKSRDRFKIVQFERFEPLTEILGSKYK